MFRKFRKCDPKTEGRAQQSQNTQIRHAQLKLDKNKTLTFDPLFCKKVYKTLSAVRGSAPDPSAPGTRWGLRLHTILKTCPLPPPNS